MKEPICSPALKEWYKQVLEMPVYPPTPYYLEEIEREYLDKLNAWRKATGNVLA